jgi:hypothetical protein
VSALAAPAPDVTVLPDLDAEVPCQAHVQYVGSAPRPCGTTPVTHEIRFSCSRGCPPQRHFVCSVHAAVARSIWPAGLALDRRCGDPASTVTIRPTLGGAR